MTTQQCAECENTGECVECDGRGKQRLSTATVEPGIGETVRDREGCEWTHGRSGWLIESDIPGPAMPWSTVTSDGPVLLVRDIDCSYCLGSGFCLRCGTDPTASAL